MVAGGGEKTNAAPAGEIVLSAPFGVDFDRAGNLFMVELNGFRVRKIDGNGWVRTIGGTGAQGSNGDGGPALQAQFNGIHNLAIAPNDDIYLADTWNNRVRNIDAESGIVTTVAGTGSKGFGGDGGPARAALFGGIYCVSLDPSAENLYLADLDNRRIRAVNLRTGVVKTIAGNGQKGVPEDGAEAVNSPLIDPRAVAATKRSGMMLRIIKRPYQRSG
ncbi:MAG: hypothetical protein O2960_21245 [Verrucomicrobia bacterium]|nr:hypothetical protein [Verrucomicrobiota bacterium]